MYKIAVLLLIASLTVTACGSMRDSSLNPANWFGSSSAAPVEPAANTNPLIPEQSGIFAERRAQQDLYVGRPIDTVSNLVVERIPGGAIIRATGVAATQGVHDIRLIPATEDEVPVDGVLAYRLEGIPPAVATPVGSPATRQVVAARRVSDQMLAGVRSIRVEGDRNAQVTSR
jgi:hypothetical protein